MSGGNRKWIAATVDSGAAIGSMVGNSAMQFTGTIAPTTGELTATILAPGLAPVTWAARRLKDDVG